MFMSAHVYFFKFVYIQMSKDISCADFQAPKHLEELDVCLHRHVYICMYAYMSVHLFFFTPKGTLLFTLKGAFQ